MRDSSVELRGPVIRFCYHCGKALEATAYTAALCIQCETEALQEDKVGFLEHEYKRMKREIAFLRKKNTELTKEVELAQQVLVEAFQEVEE